MALRHVNGDELQLEAAGEIAEYQQQVGTVRKSLAQRGTERLMLR